MLAQTLTYNEQKAIDLQALAASHNCDLIVADDNTLLVDLDNADSKNTFQSNLPIVKQKYSVVNIERWPSKSRRGEHVMLKLSEPVDVVTRLLLQATLGSDLKRELLGLYLVKRNHPTPSVLFKPQRKRRIGEG